jgi:transketolase
MAEHVGGVENGEQWEDLAVRTIRALAMDAVRKANSGHPGTAMALAPLAHVLFGRIMEFDPSDPGWADRDRFVLSAGHASILLYSLLHLTGFDVTLEDLESFRQLGSRTPGHPEVGMTPGVEVTTGPLGQGLANAVGLAIAERQLRADHGADLCSHRTWVVAGDGCLEEGISHEAASLAGHLGLGRLICVYDDNHITIDGPTELALSDDAAARFRAYGWQVIELGEMANDLAAIEAGLREAMADEERPSLVILRSHIGYPSPKFTDSPLAHGNPFPPEEIALTKELMGLDPEGSFQVPSEVLDGYAGAIRRGRKAREAWLERLAAAGSKGVAFTTQISGDLSAAIAAPLPSFEVGAQIATRRSFATCLATSAPLIPGLLSGSADLTENTGTDLPGGIAQSSDDPEGRQVYFGIREHAMAAAMTGMALHGGVLPVGGTFFVFSDYMRGAIRVAAISDAKVVYVFTHDSIGVGEDGPTHQPIEQVASLRAMPGVSVVRPADANECAVAWRAALEADGPVALILSRQNLPVLAETAERSEGGLPDGGYVLAEFGEGALNLVIVATGSEVAISLEAARTLGAEGVCTRVVSLPCMEWFLALPEGDREAVVPRAVPTLSVEAGTTFGWGGLADRSLGIDRFGASAPGPEVFAHLGITVDGVLAEARALLSSRS